MSVCARKDTRDKQNNAKAEWPNSRINLIGDELNLIKGRETYTTKL